MHYIRERRFFQTRLLFVGFHCRVYGEVLMSSLFEKPLMGRKKAQGKVQESGSNRLTEYVATCYSSTSYNHERS
jgi:hypothetical protein